MSGSDGGFGADRRQLLLASLAVVALVVAALVAPVAADQPQPESDSEESGEDGEGGSGDFFEWLAELLSDGDGEPPEDPPEGPGPGPRGDEIVINGSGDGDVEIDGREFQGDCAVVLSDEPKPGGPLGVTVYDTDGPVEDAEVRFNDELVGLTDPGGSVSGEVPYESELTIDVVFPDGKTCDLSTETASSAGLASAGVPLSGDRLAAVPPLLDHDEDGSNVSVPVNGSVTVEVLGEVIPGETVDVRATVEGNPMKRSPVLVDGERVGETDMLGSYELRVPDDGRASLNVTVYRGDFSGTREVVLQVLELSVQPRGLLSLPGGEATVVARVGGDPAQNATVTLAGEQLGTTDEDGHLTLTLPENTDATLSVATATQTAGTTMGEVYGATVLFSAVYFLLTLAAGAIGYRRRGRRAAFVAVYVGVALFAVLVVVALYGWLPGGIALLASAVTLALIVRSMGSGSVTEDSRSLLAWLRSLPGRLPTLVVETARWLGGVLDDAWALLSAFGGWLRSSLADLRAWLAAQPRSIRALAGRFASWVVALPGNVAAALTPARVAGVPVAVTVTLDGYVTLGLGGATLGALGSLLVAALGSWSSPSTPSTESASQSTRDATPSQPPTAGISDPDQPPTTLRERWRRFARWVRPGDWRTSSAAEVERTATERGYPDDAARTLTEAFRLQEYSEDRTLPERIRERAREAYERLDDHRRGGGEGT